MHESPAVLVIAGSDSSGGAGVLRDAAVLTEHNVAACCAITAITAQTNDRLARIEHVAPHVVYEQIVTGLRSRRVEAIKIGMLGTAQIVEAVADALRDVTAPIVLDPVLHASSGAQLLDDAGIARMREILWPMATVLTPNLPEAAALTGTSQAADEDAMLLQAKALLAHGPQAVLLKGGHAHDLAVDLLVTSHGCRYLRAERIAAEMRGTGCMLATAIAAGLASGAPLHTACERAKSYVHRKLAELSCRMPAGLDKASL